MDRSAQIKLCKACKNHAFDREKGIVCGLTNQKPTFEIGCNDFKSNGTDDFIPKTDKKKVRTKRFVITTVILITGLLLLYYSARFIGIIEYYIVSSPACEPALMEGAEIMAIRFAEPKRKDFIVFERYNQKDKSSYSFISRVCGTPGDTVQIKMGTLYVNGEDSDKDLILKHQYRITPRYFNYLSYNEKVEQKDIAKNEISYLSVNLIDSIAKDSVNVGLQWLPPGMPDPFIYEIYSEPWNIHQFGPVVVPENKYFVLGDNRDNSFDSRFFGFVPNRNVVAVVW